MKKLSIKHLLSVILLFVTLTVSATDFTGATPESGKSYYVYNVGTGLYLTEGDNWGTHASVSNVGTDIRLATNGEGFSIRTHFGSKYLSWADNGLWMDQSTSTRWMFTLVEGTEDCYTINCDGKTEYVQCTEGKTKVTSAALPDNAALAHWKLLPASVVEEQMETASYTNPADITYLIPNSCFHVSYNDPFEWAGGINIDGYRGDYEGTAGGNYVAFQKDNNFDGYTEISAKAGIYKLVAQGCNYSKNGENSLDAELYVGNSYVVLPDAMTGSAQDGELATMAKAIADGEYVAEEQMMLTMSTTFKIGFRKTTNKLGDISMIDNLRLYYYGSTLEDYQAFLADQKTEAESLQSKRMSASAATTLATAIEAYSGDKSTKPKCGLMATKITKAISGAKRSIKFFNQLQSEIDAANTFAAEATGDGVDALKTAIATAQAAYDNTETTDTDIKTAIKAIKRAISDYRFSNGEGQAPTVVTDPRFARGGTMAFGRMTVSGVPASEILEEGFCFATHDNPTYNDNYTTDYLYNNGKIFWIRGLEPGKVYYMRAYALTKSYAIGYGDVLKVVTIPKGDVGYSINGFPADAHTRVAAGAAQAKQLWSDLTSIKGYNSSINYGSGTPTADCSYGGWMRIGPNASYQRTGTILHEWLHGVGVGTHYVWQGSELRRDWGRGDWLGDRTTDVIRFWNNNTTEYLTGDNTHMWPYGVNGAHEDNGTNELYIGLSLIIQALCEDGLPPTGGFGLPAYCLDVDNDDTKYYIKNESTSHGLFDSYLFVEADGSLKWKKAKAETVNDSCAWTITFTASNAYYQMRNVATGRYLTYANSTFTTAERSKPAGADNLHLMRGRADVGDVKGLRGYYIIHPEHNHVPPTMVATANGKVASSAYDLSVNAKSQRWLISTIDEYADMDKGFIQLAMDELDATIATMRTFLSTPHTQHVETADAVLTSLLAHAESQKTMCVNSQEVEELTAQVKDGGFRFLGCVEATDPEQPFDLTYMISTPRMDKTDGWIKTSDPGISFSCAEYYVRTFDFYQTITGLPAGTYKMTVQGFQRPGEASVVYKNFTDGKGDVTTTVYAGKESTPIKNAMEGASDTKLGGAESEVGKQFIPNNMEAASIYFKAGRYTNEVSTQLTEAKNNLKIGIKCTEAPDWYWTIFDYFNLYSFGNQNYNAEVGIEDIMSEQPAAEKNVYSINGTLLRRGTDSLDGLPRGIYIVGGKKVVK